MVDTNLKETGVSTLSTRMHRSTYTSDEQAEDVLAPDLSEHNNRVVRHLFHVQQKYDWDCGVSAVAMCLNSSQRHDLFVNLSFFRFNDQTGFDTSTWTIDLCYILSYFDIKCTIYTAVLGVNPDLKKEAFYSSAVDRDMERVSKLFRESEKHGIKAVKQCVQLETLIYLLKMTGPLIVLVNANLLYCLDCPWNFPSCSPWCAPSFQGHYIVVVGYDLRRNLIYYRNPGLTARICLISFNNFNLARSSFGTDYDVISLTAEGNSYET